MEDGEKRIWEEAKSREDLEEQVMHNYMFTHVFQGLEEQKVRVREQQSKEDLGTMRRTTGAALKTGTRRGGYERLEMTSLEK